MPQICRRVDCIVGARPNFVKIAPIMRALAAYPAIRARLIHTGQHYDLNMNAVFFDELDIPAPDIQLGIGSASAVRQTAQIMMALEPVWTDERPDLVLVVGDVNSTLAAALTAARLRVPIAHVEAGLRSHDDAMPEEINRVITDRLSDLLFVTERSAIQNLIREGISAGKIVFSGNVMIDTLRDYLDRAVPAAHVLAEISGNSGEAEQASTNGFGLVTLHRPANLEDGERLKQALAALAAISQRIPLVFPLHPRTKASLEGSALMPILAEGSIIIAPPLSYLRSIGLMKEAKFVITDSGGIQEETTALGTPCFTFRDNTERPITIEQGTNTLVGTSAFRLIEAVETLLSGGGKKGSIPEKWDGKAAIRIADGIAEFFAPQAVGPQHDARGEPVAA
ncbi:MAG TPA: UDP-N-acetylglucosamine 2-epimerase (non-hydrolyzing) [Hyphomicrobiales bacterium]|nr:UDP-N-acetylglucosamine 2-epimerase (non-hydrolyzing) [Hyphomicrobiales bacterium]